MPIDDPRSWDDLTLARRCAAREEAAWEEFLRRFGPAVQGVLRHVFAKAGLPDPLHEAEEALGDLARALLHRDAASLRAYRPPATLQAYLRVVARNTAVDLLRRRRASLSLDAASPGRPPLRDLLEAPGATEPEFGAEELERALARLPSQEVLALRLAYWDGKPLAEVARILGIPLGTLGPLMTRARAALRQALGK